jgi:hypothetical protein
MTVCTKWLNRRDEQERFKSRHICGIDARRPKVTASRAAETIRLHVCTARFEPLQVLVPAGATMRHRDVFSPRSTAVSDCVQHG